MAPEQRSRIRRLTRADGPEDGEGQREVNVVPFLDIITNVLMFVLATVAVTFTATIDVDLRPGGIRPPDAKALGLAVLVTDGGFGLKTRGGNVATGCSDVGAGLTIPKRGASYDYDALRRCAEKLKAISPLTAGERGVTVSASPAVPYEVVIATVDAVRTSEAGAQLFPEVAFAIAR
jgi:biopolymer transport protein ExbD